MEFQFYMGTEIFFGESCFDTLLEKLKKLQIKRLGIVVDHNLCNLDITQKLVDDIKKLSSVVIGNVNVSEPTYQYLEEFRQQFMDTEIEAVIGIGGGSSIDLAKGIGVLVHNKEKAISYRGFDKMTERVLPIIAIPTTAGSGSEVTPNASFVDDTIKKKLGINGEAIRPRYAFLNPRYLLSCPEKAAISSGIDALVHAVEAFAAKKATYVSRIFSKQAVGLIYNNLATAVFDKKISAVKKVSLGSLFAAISMMNSGTGPAAAFSYPLGVHKKVPHGIAGGIFLPKIMAWNFDNGYFGYGEFFSELSGPDTSISQMKKARYVIDGFETLWKELSIPFDLKEYGINSKDIDIFLEDILELSGAINQNPVKMKKNDILTIMEKFL